MKQKAIRFDSNMLQKNDPEETKSASKNKWFEVVKSHPEVFHIPNFLSVRKKLMKQKQHQVQTKEKVRSVSDIKQSEKQRQYEI